MKILNVNFSIDTRSGGGTAERTCALSRFLQKKGIDCRVLTLAQSDDLHVAEILPEVKIIVLPCVLKRFYVPLVSLRRLEKIISSVDLIHLIGHWTILNALVYYVAKKLNKPYIFSPAGAFEIFGRSKIKKKIYNWIVGHKIAKNANGIIALTNLEADFFIQYGIEKTKITLIPNGLDIDGFLSQTALPNQGKFILPSKYILFVGRLNPIKGPDLLMQAFKNLATDFWDVHLVYAGVDEGLLKPLLEEAQRAGVHGRVHFMGFVSGHEKLQIYQNALLLVIPSRHEAMSIVVLEAGAVGRPVVLTDQCGFDEVQEVKGGLVVSVTVEGIESGLRRLLVNPQLASEMGENLKNHVFSHFSWDAQVEKLIRLYRQIVST